MWPKVVDWWENNRVIGIGFLCLATAILFGFFFGEGSPLKRGTEAQSSAPDTVGLRKILDEADRRGTPQVETEQEENKRIAGQYEEEAAQDRNAPDSPAKLVAAGNLYLEKLNDAKRAAGCYSVVVSQFPNWEGTAAVYPQLLKAYDLAGMQMERLRLLMQMTERFPPESPEHQYAQSELGKHP